MHDGLGPRAGEDVADSCLVGVGQILEGEGGWPQIGPRPRVSQALTELPAQRDGGRLRLLAFAPARRREDDYCSRYEATGDEGHTREELTFECCEIVIEALSLGGDFLADVRDSAFRHGFSQSRSCARPLRSPARDAEAKPCAPSSSPGVQGSLLRAASVR